MRGRVGIAWCVRSGSLSRGGSGTERGRVDGDDKKDDFYGKRYIIGRMYYIFRSRTGLDGMHHAEVYECNIDYSGHLEINGYSDEYTFAVSKRNNIIYSWQYFECLDQ